MNESKIELTERLRCEGRWSEAGRFKDATIRKLRAEGVSRRDAAEQAWAAMAEAYRLIDCADAMDILSPIGDVC